MTCEAQADTVATLRERAEMVHDLLTSTTMLEAATMIERLVTLCVNQQAEIQRLSTQPN